MIYSKNKAIKCLKSSKFYPNLPPKKVLRSENVDVIYIVGGRESVGRSRRRRTARRLFHDSPSDDEGECVRNKVVKSCV